MKRVPILCFTVLILSAALAQAQPSPDAKASFWRLVEKQSVLNLASPHAEIRAIALKNTIVLATLYRDKVHFDGVVAPIILLCEKSGRERKMAFAALQAIGTERALAYLAEHATKEQAHLSAEVIASVLKEHYAKKSTAML